MQILQKFMLKAEKVATAMYPFVENCLFLQEARTVETAERAETYCRSGQGAEQPEPFRHKTKYAAEPGQEGDGRKMHGKNGKDLILKVPEGHS